MKTSDPILFRELPIIQKVIDDETWLEGERRGCEVSPDDQVVREKVCEIVLRIGQELRDSLIAAIAKSTANGQALAGTNEADAKRLRITRGRSGLSHTDSGRAKGRVAERLPVPPEPKRLRCSAGR